MSSASEVMPPVTQPASGEHPPSTLTRIKPHPIPWFQLAAGCVAALALGTAAAGVLDHFKFERLPATYEAGPFNVSAGRPARILALLVPQGTRVEAKQPLVSLADDTVERLLAEKEAAVRSLEAELAATQGRVELDVEKERRSLKQELFETKLRAAQYEQSRFASQMEKAAFEEMAREPAIHPAGEIDWIAALRAENPMLEDPRVKTLLRQGTAANAEVVAASQVALCEQRMKDIEASLAELPNKLTGSPEVQAVKTRLEQAKADLESLRQSQTEITICSDRSGVVGTYRRGVGDRVTASETIVQVVDDAKRYVCLKVDSSRLKDFTVGTTFDLKFVDGSLRQGRIVEVQPQAEAVPGSTPQLCVRLEQAGATWPQLPFGTAVEVRRTR